MNNSLHRQGTLYGARWITDPQAKHWALAGVLNHYNVTPSELAGMRLVGKPLEFLYLLLFDQIKRQQGANMRAKRMAKARHYWHSLPRITRRSPMTSRRASEMIEALGFTQDCVRQMLDVPSLTRDFYLEDGVTKAVQQATFSYGETDYESELSSYSQIRCPECKRYEVLPYDEGVSLLQSARKFDHLSGPYCRCCRCDAAVRVVVTGAENLPDDHDLGDPDAWNIYLEDLEQILDDMTQHLVSKGYPKPDILYLGARNIDWRNREGWATCEVTAKALAKAMSVNSDFMVNGRLRLGQDGSAEICATLYHHDAPTGGSITVTPAWWCRLGERDDSLIEQGKVEESRFLAKVATIMLPGLEKEFEYSADSTFDLVSREGLVEGLRWLAEQFDLEQGQEGLAGYSQALSLLLDRLIDDIHCERTVYLPLVEQTRQVLDHWISHSTEEECRDVG